MQKIRSVIKTVTVKTYASLLSIASVVVFILKDFNCYKISLLLSNCFQTFDGINNSKLIPKPLAKVALTYNCILDKKLLTEVVKRVVNGMRLLQNENRIKYQFFRKKTELIEKVF